MLRHKIGNRQDRKENKSTNLLLFYIIFELFLVFNKKNKRNVFLQSLRWLKGGERRKRLTTVRSYF